MTEPVQPPAATQPPAAAQPPAATQNQNQPPKVDDKGAPPAAAADGKPAAPRTSIYDAVGLDEPGAKGSQVWPENWREQFAGDDKEAQTRLARYGSPKDVARALLAAQQKISSGEYKRSTPAPEGATEEVLAKWREDNGLPVKSEAYEILPKGAAIEDMDDKAKATLATFQKGFLQSNLTQEQAKGVSNVIYEMAQNQIAEQAKNDANQMNTLEDTLRAEWGPDYRSNTAMNAAHAVKVFGEDLGMDILTGARLADGTKLANIPEFNKVLNAWARSEGGDILYDGGGSTAKTVDARIAEIEKTMNTDFSKYTQAMADEYTALLNKKEARGK